MKKTNPKIKEFISIENKTDAIKAISNSYFRKEIDEDGNSFVEYVPYQSEIAQVIVIVKFFMEGIEFDENESIYDTVTSDKQLCNIINSFISSSIFSQIMEQVEDIVEYRKAENIAKIQNESNMVLSYKIMELINKETEKAEKEIQAANNLNKWVDEQRELNSLITPEMQRDFAESFDPEALTRSIIEKYTESDLYEKNKEVVKYSRQLREKDNKIINLQNELERNKQKDNVKNVIADK